MKIKPNNNPSIEGEEETKIVQELYGDRLNSKEKLLSGEELFKETMHIFREVMKNK